MPEKKAAEKSSAGKTDHEVKASPPKAEKPAERRVEKLKVELRDESEQTAYDVESLVVRLGGRVTSSGKQHLTVECPPGSDRHPGAAREKLVEGLSTDPLVNSVESA